MNNDDRERRIAELEVERQQVFAALEERAESQRRNSENRAKVAALAERLRQP